jgi:glucose-6-phosphate dehydrogenase assembly protein OpcA
MSATVSPDRILKELSELWVTMGKQGQVESGASVLRACSMTLLVFAEDSDDAAALGETVAALMPEHPARTVHVRLCGQGERALSERVYAQCWMPFGQRRQICCEQVEITAADAALADLPSVVLPLTVSDLPVILWCRAPRLLGMAEFRPIASMARKVVLDSAAMPNAKAALRLMAVERDHGIMLGDLAWTRLTRWREMLSQVFENRQRLARLAALRRVVVNYGPTYETAARYMAAWIGGAVSSGGARPRLEVAASQDVPTLRVELEGEGLHVELSRREDTLVIEVNELSHCTSLPFPTDYLLMREELGIVRRDDEFERALASAARLAYPTEQ